MDVCGGACSTSRGSFAVAVSGGGVGVDVRGSLITTIVVAVAGVACRSVSFLMVGSMVSLFVCSLLPYARYAADPVAAINVNKMIDIWSHLLVFGFERDVSFRSMMTLFFFMLSMVR